MSHKSKENDKISILLLGNSFVGKTSITKQYTSGIFNFQMMNTIGVDYSYKSIIYKNKPYNLKIWDTAGQERFQHVSRNFVRKANGLMFVFDITNFQTFSDIIECYRVCEEENNLDNVGCILVGNKSDLFADRAVSTEMAEQQAKSLGLKYLEMSAKTGENVEEGFLQILEKILQKRNKKSGLGNIDEIDPIHLEDEIRAEANVEDFDNGYDTSYNCDC